MFEPELAAVVLFGDNDKAVALLLYHYVVEDFRQ